MICLLKEWEKICSMGLHLKDGCLVEHVILLLSQLHQPIFFSSLLFLNLHFFCNCYGHFLHWDFLYTVIDAIQNAKNQKIIQNSNNPERRLRKSIKIVLPSSVTLYIVFTFLPLRSISFLRTTSPICSNALYYSISCHLTFSILFSISEIQE